MGLLQARGFMQARRRHRPAAFPRRRSLRPDRARSWPRGGESGFHCMSSSCARIMIRRQAHWRFKICNPESGIVNTMPRLLLIARVCFMAAMMAILSALAVRADPIKVAISQRGFWDSSFIDFAIRQNFFKQEGLEIEPFYTEGGASTLDAVISACRTDFSES